MLENLIALCKELFPSISDETHKAAEEAIQKMQEASLSYALISSPLEDVQLAQGDIFDSVPFWHINGKGHLLGNKMMGMLLTNTCDNQRRENLLFAPFRPLKDISTVLGNQKDKIDRLKDNGYFYFLYLNEKDISDKVVDFNQIVTINRELFCERLKEKKVNRLFSLSQIGYYIFITKLTIFFMRYEDKGVNTSRSI